MGQSISTYNFYFYGKKHFTQSGYLNRMKNYTETVQKTSILKKGEFGADDVDLTGRVIVVTGANSGLGKEIAKYVASKNATLYMLCRSQERGQIAQKEIQTLVPEQNDKNVKLIQVDVSELAQVRRAVNELESQEDKIDALVCNAGVLLNERTETSEGNEATFASHLLGGTYLLGKLLVPRLQASKFDGRIIIVTSGGMYNYKCPKWDILSCKDTIKYDGVNAYAYAKRAQVLLAEQWSKEYPTLKTITAHPGWSDTPALAEAFGEKTLNMLKPLRTPWEGAEGITWLVSTDGSNIQSGELYLDRQIETKHMSGFFGKEGTYTKNTPQEINELMKQLKLAAGI